MKIPVAISEQASLISLTKRTVTIDCDSRDDAEELLDWLLNLASNKKDFT
jgi:hypothetical protein